MNEKNNKRAILYLRFSSEKQKGNTSIGTQEKLCRIACEAAGFEIVDVVKDEGVSADKQKDKKTQRVAQLLEYCKENKERFDVLMVFKLSRFARAQEHHHWLRARLLEMGILLRSATEKIDETPAGRLVEGVLAAVNEYDNEVRREQNKLAMWRRVEQGFC